MDGHFELSAPAPMHQGQEPLEHAGLEMVEQARAGRWEVPQADLTSEDPRDLGADVECGLSIPGFELTEVRLADASSLRESGLGQSSIESLGAYGFPEVA
ncbi:MAG TPA: hypothetical protein VFW92_07355 [Candidatus Limnocylindrales bacterium]|nr:hypothetical protein [Candidatus Limnocylindrales bacterium]